MVGITEDGTSTAGSTFTLTCTVQKTRSGFRNSPMPQWTVKGQRTAVTESDDIIIKTGSSTSNLTFSPLRTSHGGVYTCQGNLTTPALTDQYSLKESQEVKVESKVIILFSSIIIFPCIIFA